MEQYEEATYHGDPMVEQQNDSHQQEEAQVEEEVYEAPPPVVDEEELLAAQAAAEAAAAAQQSQPGGAFNNVAQGLTGRNRDIMMQYWQETINSIEHDDHDFKNHQLPLARIKKVMKTDEDVRMISAEAPILFAKGCDVFITELTMRAWIHAEENKRRTLQKSDIASALTKSDMFDFLIDVVPREEEKPKKSNSSRFNRFNSPRNTEYSDAHQQQHQQQPQEFPSPPSQVQDGQMQGVDARPPAQPQNPLAMQQDPQIPHQSGSGAINGSSITTSSVAAAPASHSQPQAQQESQYVQQQEQQYAQQQDPQYAQQQQRSHLQHHHPSQQQPQLPPPRQTPPAPEPSTQVPTSQQVQHQNNNGDTAYTNFNFNPTYENGY